MRRHYLDNFGSLVLTIIVNEIISRIPILKILMGGR